MKKWIITGIGMLVAGHGNAQNLVPNASFENIINCPESATRDAISALDGWNQPGEGTPDVFNTCSDRCHPRRNFIGGQAPYKGKGYAGFIGFSNEIKTYHEYLQVELNQTLVKDQVYLIQFYVSLADLSGYAISNIGCGLNRDKTKLFTNFAFTPDYLVETLKTISDTANWTQVRFEYTAHGDERFLILGNFRKYHEMKQVKQVVPRTQSSNNADAYYYVDEVEVSPLHYAAAKNPEPATALKEYYKNDSTLVIQNLEFAYNSYQLNDADRVKLDEIAAYFARNNNYCLTVEGHTDNSGRQAYNQTLSEQRAGSVKDFLTGKGIAPATIQSKGYGYSRPLVKELSSPKNRRVEIKFYPCR